MAQSMFLNMFLSRVLTAHHHPPCARVNPPIIFVSTHFQRMHRNASTTYLLRIRMGSDKLVVMFLQAMFIEICIDVQYFGFNYRI
jgi:hypothetical protein